MKEKFKSKIIIALFVLLLIAGLTAGGYYFYSQYQKILKQAQNPTDANKKENLYLIAQVGKLILLPDNEEPSIATVMDVEKLKEQQLFFANAQNGDKVLIYTQAKKAILYRPSENKIIEVSPLAINSPTSTPIPSPTPTINL